MELIFADDSGKDAPGKNLIEACVAFNEEFLPDLERHITQIKRRYGIPEDSEVHWSNRVYRHQVRGRMVVGCRLTAAEHDALRRDMLSFLGTCEATIIAAALGPRYGGRTLSSKVASCLELLAERAQFDLQELFHVEGRNVLGLLIADIPGSSKETREVQARLQTLHKSGSLFISRFDNLVMNSVLYPSHLVPGIQLADFVAGAFDRFLNQSDVRWWNVLEPHVRRKRRTQGRVLGYGLVVRPDVRPLRIGSVIVN